MHKNFIDKYFDNVCNSGSLFVVYYGLIGLIVAGLGCITLVTGEVLFLGMKPSWAKMGIGLFILAVSSYLVWRFNIALKNDAEEQETATAEHNGTDIVDFEIKRESLEDSFRRQAHPDTVRFIQGETLSKNEFGNVFNDLQLELCYETSDYQVIGGTIGYFVIKGNLSVIGVKAANDKYTLLNHLVNGTICYAPAIFLTKIYKRSNSKLRVVRTDGEELYKLFFGNDFTCRKNGEVDWDLVIHKIGFITDEDIQRAVRDYVKTKVQLIYDSVVSEVEEADEISEKECTIEDKGQGSNISQLLDSWK